MVAPGEENLPLQETLGGSDPRIEALVENAPLRQAIGTLENRVQEIVRLHFFAGYSQRQVADVLGISQMQVSRLERRTLAQLRTRLVEAV